MEEGGGARATSTPQAPPPPSVAYGPVYIYMRFTPSSFLKQWNNFISDLFTA